MKLKDGRWRKATDVESKYATFEFIVGDALLLGVVFSEEEVFSIAFGEKITNQMLAWDELVEVVKTGRELAELDM